MLASPCQSPGATFHLAAGGCELSVVLLCIGGVLRCWPDEFELVVSVVDERQIDIRMLASTLPPRAGLTATAKSDAFLGTAASNCSTKDA